jgi:hypothetical protein
LLAYLDGILDPNDSQDLSKKIEESEFATSLVHRIRDVMRRLRLGAPNLTDRGPGLDPNTVAEYLDNTLPADRVTDFEKVCLDSDIHLAEVAACHQVLALVLGEPADVDPASRERIYELKDVRAGAKPPPTPALSPAPALPLGTALPSLDLEGGDGEPAGRKARPRPTVPEYLREPRKRPAWLPVAAVAVLAVGFMMVVLMALGQFEPKTLLGDLLVEWGIIAAPREVAAGQKGEIAEKKNAAQPTKQAPEPAKKQVVQPIKVTPKQPSAETPKPRVEPANASTTVAPPPVRLPLVTPPVPKPAAEKTSVGPVKEPVTEPAKEPAVGSSKTVAKLPTPKLPAAEPTIKPPAAPRADAEKEKKATPPAPPTWGRFLSTDQVLLSGGPGGDWTRVAADQALIAEQILALPTYRAKVSLMAAGVNLEILGPARVELLGDSRGLPGIRVFYGRVVLTPIAGESDRLRVALGDRVGTLTFVDPDSTAALDVRRLRAPGTNPETGPSRIAADLYATSGNITWEEAASDKTDKGDKSPEPLRLTSSQRLSFDAQLTSPPMAAKELPKWITAEPISPLDRLASPKLAQALATGRPARVGLLELATSRPQWEVKWLALRCLGCVGQFRDMVAALSEPAQRFRWADYYIDELRSAVARDAETAAAVRLALETQYPQQAATLYRMLWGYSEQDLEDGADAKLVQALDDETLAVRVLAIWNLRDITGVGQSYQPEERPAKRQPAARRWRQRLEAKEIRLKTTDEKTVPAGENIAPLPPVGGK